MDQGEGGEKPPFESQKETLEEAMTMLMGNK